MKLLASKYVTSVPKLTIYESLDQVIERNLRELELENKISWIASFSPS